MQRRESGEASGVQGEWLGGIGINGPGDTGCGQGVRTEIPPGLADGGKGEKKGGREEERQDLGLSPRTWCGMQNNGPKDNPHYLQTGEYAIFHGKRDLQVQLKV